MIDPANPQQTPPAAGDHGSDAEASPARVERLFREHNDSLLRFLAARLGSREEARELAQEAYVRVLKLDAPGAVSYLRAFLFKTASNLAIDRIRTRRYRERPAALEFFERLPATTTPEREADGAQELQLLQRLLHELPPKCQYAFVMNRIHGVDIAELSREMAITETMVRRYIMRALIHCRTGLDKATGERHGRE